MKQGFIYADFLRVNQAKPSKHNFVYIFDDNKRQMHKKINSSHECGGWWQSWDEYTRNMRKFLQTFNARPVLALLLSALAPDTKNAEAIICSDKCKADKLAGSKGDQPTLPRNINIDEPRYDQSTYRNRAIYFLTVTNPLNIFVSSKELDRAKFIVTKYRNGEELPSCVGVEELWHAKNLYDSAFHPDTGEKMWICGRMSAQVPMNMLITGGMMTFYKSTSSVIFWQWLNQSFNALVNYTNRSGDQAISNTQLGASYVLATSGALATALTLNNAVKRFPPVVGRMVPFAAVAAANCINIPLMRMQELSEGVPVFDQDNLRLGSSKVAAREGIAQVVISRILMASPGMAITPFIMNHLERKGVLRRYPWANAPIQIGLLGVFLTFATPLCCAIFRQKASIRVANLEPELREEIMKKSSNKDIEYVYYNKGL